MLRADGSAASHLHLVAFDLLELAGDDIRSLPLLQRTALLREAFPTGDRLRLIQTRPSSRSAHDRLVELDAETKTARQATQTLYASRRGPRRQLSDVDAVEFVIDPAKRRGARPR